MTHLLKSTAILFAVLLIGAISPISKSTQASAAQQPSEHIIEIKNFMFMKITVPQGTKVTWVNRDDVPHTVIERRQLFHSAALDTNDRFSYVFDKPGTYDYFCSLHPQMVAKVVVQAVKP